MDGHPLVRQGQNPAYRLARHPAHRRTATVRCRGRITRRRVHPMSRWIVAIESRAPAETEPLANPAAQRTKLLRSLADHACEVGVGSGSWSVTIEGDHDDDIGDIRHVTEI